MKNSSNVLSKPETYVREVMAQYCDFLKVSGLNPIHYYMEVDIIRLMVKRYLDDVERLHRHHNIGFIDCYKIAGYLTYWICRLRPIRVVSKIVFQGDIAVEKVKKAANQSFFINELFAMFLGIGRIDSRYKKDGIGTSISLSKDIVNTMLYGLKYRHTTGDMLSLTYAMIDATCSK